MNATTPPARTLSRAFDSDR